MPSELQSVRDYYGVPAYRGELVRFSGLPSVPIVGRILSASAHKLWIREGGTGRRYGPLHPTWRMEYL